MQQPEPDALVSVIIPCYNHGRFLPEAIESIRQQHYAPLEIVVVDDGSVDDTKKIAAGFPDVKYVYQPNQGLSAARNTGIQNSNGVYLVFLDADDWLLPHAIATNVRYLKENARLAFVSGAHIKVFDDGTVVDVAEIVEKDHYCQLLKGNYIGMHATVMYKRWVFDSYKYDINLPNCEDYDLYLKIARHHPVWHHQKKIAAYRIHTTNMSGNIPKMLKGVLNVLKKQKNVLQNRKEKQAFLEGLNIWKEYYATELYKALCAKRAKPETTGLLMLMKYKPVHLLKYMFKKSFHV